MVIPGLTPRVLCVTLWAGVRSEEAIKFYPLDPQASECRLLGKKGDKRSSKEEGKVRR